MPKRDTVIVFRLIFKAFRIIAVTEKVEEVTGRSDESVEIEALPLVIKRKCPLIHESLQIVVTNTMAEGERRLFEAVHRIGKESP